MWHLKTKVGVFWVVPLQETTKEGFLLGLNDDELCTYTDADQAARDVHDQSTGFFKWDLQPRIKAPEHLQGWVQGEPNDWKKH